MMAISKRYIPALTLVLFASSCSPECGIQESVGELLLGKNPSGLTRPVTSVRWGKEVLPDDLDWLARQTSIEHLYIGDSLADADLEHLSELRNLRSLSLTNADQVTDKGLKSLRKLTQLRFLDVRESRIAGPGLEHLKSLTELREVRLVNSDVSGPGLEYLKDAPELSSVSLTGSPVTDSGLAHLSQLENVTGAVLDGTRITDSGLRFLARLDKLAGLILDDTAVTGSGLAHLRTLPRITSLSLVRCTINDSHTAYLKELESLRSLDLNETDMSEEGLGRLRQALPDCRICCRIGRRGGSTAAASPVGTRQRTPSSPHSIRPTATREQSPRPVTGSRSPIPVRPRPGSSRRKT